MQSKRPSNSDVFRLRAHGKPMNELVGEHDGCTQVIFFDVANLIELS